MTPKETSKMTPKKPHFVVSKTALGSRSKSIPKIDEKMIQKMAQKVTQKVTQKVAQKVARKNRQKSGKSGWVGAFCRPAKVRNNYTRSNIVSSFFILFFLNIFNFFWKNRYQGIDGSLL